MKGYTNMYKVIIEHSKGHASYHRIQGNSPAAIAYIPVLSDNEIDAMLRKDIE
jgi:hypothetical protein